MRSVDQLHEEHRVLELALPQIERMDTTELGAEQVLEFLEVFMDKCHHAKEERYLFPRLEARGIPKREGLVLELLKEHGVIRRYVHEIKGLLHAARGTEDEEPDPDARGLFDERLVELTAALQQHTRREDAELWPLARKTLTREDDQALLAGFAEIEEQQIGEQQYRKYLGWSRLWAA